MATRKAMGHLVLPILPKWHALDMQEPHAYTKSRWVSFLEAHTRQRTEHNFGHVADTCPIRRYTLLPQVYLIHAWVSSTPDVRGTAVS